MSAAGTRAAIKAERAKVRAKVIPEIEAHWAEVEARQALDAEESRAIVATHRERVLFTEQRRREAEAAEEAAYQEVLTAASESVLLDSAAIGRTRASGSSQSMEGQMAKLDKKQASKAAAAKATPAVKAEKAKTFCLMTGRPTNGTRFSGLGTDAKYKSVLINTALGDPHGEVTVHDNATGKASKQTAIAVLKSLNWMPFLDKARDSRTKKVEAKNEISAKKVAKQPNKKAAGTA